MLLRKLWLFVFVDLYFLTYVSCEDGISLVFAIDDTFSMRHDIDYVKRGAKAILKMVLTTKSSEVKEFVLVTINDPDVILRTKTKSAGEFLGYLNRISTKYGNSDCPERVLAGIEKALYFSKPESHIYVFTDASTKELDKFNSIRRLCQKKQSQVVFVLTGDCGMPNNRRFTIYYDIAKACSGQVFRVQKNQVQTVLKPVEILLKGRNSIFKWTTIPRTLSYVPVKVILDEKAEYAIISTSGINVNLVLTSTLDLWGPRPAADKIMWNENGKVIQLLNPRSGNYYAWVKGRSTITVVIYGRTDFTFGYGFSVLEPKSMRDTVKQPIAGLRQHISVNVTDPDHSVRIRSVQILSIKNDKVIKEIPLRNIGDSIYITEAFVPPKETFKISVKGEIKKTKEIIVRYSRHIDPQIVDSIPKSKPKIEIDEGTKLSVNYGSALTLTCKVNAHPTPRIEWYTSSGVLLPSQSSVLEDPSFVSYLKLNNIKQNETYVCKAANNLGAGKDVKIQVGVKPVFTIVSITKEPVYNVTYGKAVKIPCSIQSYLPITIKWYRSGKQLKGNSDEFSISPDGKELTLKSMDVSKQGKYTCEATLISDITVKISYDIQVNIPGLSAPKIQIPKSDIIIMEGKEMILNCIIVQGNPKPQVVWFKKNGDSYVQLSNGSNEVLTVKKAGFTDGGQYKCEAANPVGTDIATFDVKVRSIPKMYIDETIKEVPYDSNVDFTCKVESYAAPIIAWMDSRGSLIPTQMTNISEYEYISKLKLQNIRMNAVYTCIATNDVGFTNHNVQVKALSPFETKTHIKGIIEVTYGNRQTLQCDIRSVKPMAIRWYIEKTGVTSKRSLISSSDKYTLSEDGTKLTINSMDMDTSGKYTCEASLSLIATEKISFSTTVNVAGLKQPVITNKETNYDVVEEGLALKIPCDVTGYPVPTISWKKDGITLKEDSKHMFKGSALYLINPVKADSGEYICEAINDMGTDTKKFKIDILDLIPKSKPEIRIDEGTKLSVNYGSALTLTCKVNAHPMPKIEWYTSSGVLLSSNSSVVNDSSYVSYLELNDIQKNETYVCKAANTLGAGKDVKIQVGVKPVFTLIPVSKEPVYNVTYGKAVKIPCSIQSYLPITIKWYRSGKQLKGNSDGYFISPDGAELIIKSMDVSKQGKYTCEATLISDITVKISYDIQVNIPGLSAPKIHMPDGDLNVMKGEEMVLNCTIVQGNPKPQVVWFKKNGDSYVQLSNGSNEVLTVKKAGFTDGGQYKCEAANPVGTDIATFDVTVKSIPKIYLAEKSTEVPYDGNADFTCKVESYTTPFIVWKDDRRSVMPSQITKISEYEYINQLKLQNIRRNAVYACIASNDVGSINDNVQVKALSPFKIKTHIKEAIGVTYGDKQTLQCDIKSEKPMTIRWYKENIGVKSKRSLISSSDKYTLSEDGTTLTINLMDMDTSGKYTCEASLSLIATEKISFSTTVNVVGLIGPEIVYSTTVLNGINYTAICRIKGVPRPKISWYFKPQRSEKFNLIFGSGEELNIPELKLSHAGVYKCVAENHLGTTERDLNLVVKERPMIINNETNYYALEGDLVLKIPCEVTGYPEPTISWKKKGYTLKEDSKHIFKGSALYLTNPVEADSGEYTCVALNVLGNASKKFDINVFDYFGDDENFSGVTLDVDAVQGKSKTLRCNLEHITEDSVRWYLDGTLTHQTGSTYTIRGETYVDEGNYTCRVNTDDGSKSETYVVYFGYAPIFEDNSEESLVKTIVWNEDQQMLDCAADSLPEAKYKWLHDGKVLETAVDAREILITDWGQYTCQVSNVHGNISRAFNVTTTGCYITVNVITQNQPLISDVNTPAWPVSVRNRDVSLKEEDEIKLLCPNNTKLANAFKIIPNKQELIAKCKSQDQFAVDGKIYKFSELECKTKVEPYVLRTGQHCYGPNSEIIRVGFDLNNFIDNYNVCFDKNLHKPLYASVSTYIPASGVVDSTKFEWSIAPEIGDQNINENWRPEGSCKCCYTKGQLVNVNELAFGPAQASSFIYNLNSVPVWNPCDDGRTSWKEFDDNVRAMALFNKWSTWTGASDWSPTNDGLVPKFLWKVVKRDGDDTVMVYVNTKSPSDSDVKCTPCESLMEADAYLYCCTPEEFSSKFGLSTDKLKQIPNLQDVYSLSRRIL